ncbi:hypothetical protein Tco_0381564, partial [Tanacetum coccineum]
IDLTELQDDIQDENQEDGDIGSNGEAQPSGADADMTYEKLDWETLVLDVCPKLITSFRHGRGTFDFPFPDEYFDEALRNCLISHPFKAQTFHEPILYLDGLMSFKNFTKLPRRAATFFVRPADQPVDVGSRNVGGLELAVLEADPPVNVKDVSGKLGKRRSITTTLEESAPKGKGVIVGSSSKPKSKKRKQGFKDGRFFGVSVLLLSAPVPFLKELVSIRVFWPVT